MRSWKKSKQPNFLYEHCPRWERMREAGGDGTFIDLSSDEVTWGLWSFYFDPVIYCLIKKKKKHNCLKKMFSQIHLDKVGSRVSPFLKVFLSVLFLDLQGEAWSQNALMRLGKPYYYYTLLYTRTQTLRHCYTAQTQDTIFQDQLSSCCFHSPLPSCQNTIDQPQKQHKPYFGIF